MRASSQLRIRVGEDPGSARGRNDSTGEDINVSSHGRKKRLVTPPLDLTREFPCSRAHDTPFDQNVDNIGIDVIEQTLVVGDEHDAPVFGAGGVDPAGNQLESIDIEPRIRFVEEREARFEKEHLEDFVALLLPPGKAGVDAPLEKVLPEADKWSELAKGLEEFDGVIGDLAPGFADGVDRRFEIERGGYEPLLATMA